ncbi:MAG: helix-turn-helix domain-containing protein [Betaproteobacteria bacterium]|nr:helix-turn-helix domain-containing protein [Betaproteobacteria bacterium]
MPNAETANPRRLRTAQIERGYVQTSGAAAFLSLSDAWLRLLRSRGEGPPYYRLGRRVVYRRDDLIEWASRFRVAS